MKLLRINDERIINLDHVLEARFYAANPAFRGEDHDEPKPTRARLIFTMAVVRAATGDDDADDQLEETWLHGTEAENVWAYLLCEAGDAGIAGEIARSQSPNVLEK